MVRPPTMLVIGDNNETVVPVPAVANRLNNVNVGYVLLNLKQVDVSRVLVVGTKQVYFFRLNIQ